MNSVQTWGEAITKSLMDLWARFVNFIPQLVGAILVFVIGLILASVLGKVVERIVRAFHIDQALSRMHISERFRQAGFNFSVAAIFGGIVKWFLILVFLMAATDILGLAEVTKFLNDIILYLPNVLVATVILSIAVLLANFVYAIVRGSTRAAGIMSASLLATIVKWAIMIFGILAALIQLGIAPSLVNTLFIGVVGAISLAAGLAFGLGGREEAALLLRKVREEMTNK